MNFISPYALNNFLLEDINEKKISNQRHTESIETIVNKYNYIKGFCEILKNNRQILSNPFENLNEEKILSDFSLSSKENDYKLLEDNEIIEILNSYKNENNSLRNSLIFLLFLYTGLDIKEIKNLKDNDVNINSKVIYVNNRSIPLTNNILNLLKKYKNYKKTNKINCEFLFYSKYRGKYNKLNDVSFNRIISLQAFKTNLNNERKKLITPSFIKESLIKKMFENDFTIEEIKYLTGLSLTSIGKYITNDDIANKVKLKNFYKRHPYKAFFLNNII
ncbi:site-specific integrase [Clostridium sporogenes]|uniref:site-specific integrase n=1 Tax=Clostridium sporogenes TaxID=1509 RepID=UPI0021499CF7|nr:site-specific integrase [Clostridium sporogenes]MCR1974974.1 site-specific integrase [Clostridium sporogenes]